MGPDLSLKILFVVPYAPTFIRTRSLNLLKALGSIGHKITLATLWSDEEELHAIRSLDGEIDSIIFEKISRVRSIRNCFQALPGRNPVQASYSWNPRLAEKIARAVRIQDFDVIHVEHLRGAKYALSINKMRRKQDEKYPPLVWDSVDCISDLFKRASQYSHTLRARMTARFELTRTQRYEGLLTHQFDRVLVTSESDLQGLLSLAEEQGENRGSGATIPIRDRIVVVPNGVDLNYFSPPKEERESQALVITGKMSYHANITAVVRFVMDTMPKIWVEFPETELWIVGRDPSPEIRKLGAPFDHGMKRNQSRKKTIKSRIRITGTVEDIRPYLRKATAAIAPIRYGVGIQNKVLEAMSCGTPVVATRSAVGSIQARSGVDLMVAEGEHELAPSIIALLKDKELCSRLGRAGRDFAETNHNWHTIAKQLTQIYYETGAKNKAVR